MKPRGARNRENAIFIGNDTPVRGRGRHTFVLCIYFYRSAAIVIFPVLEEALEGRDIALMSYCRRVKEDRRHGGCA